MRGGHAHEVSVVLRVIVACPQQRVEASALAMALCLMMG